MFLLFWTCILFLGAPNANSNYNYFYSQPQDNSNGVPTEGLLNINNMIKPLDKLQQVLLNRTIIFQIHKTQNTIIRSRRGVAHHLQLMVVMVHQALMSILLAFPMLAYILTNLHSWIPLSAIVLLLQQMEAPSTQMPRCKIAPAIIFEWYLITVLILLTELEVQYFLLVLTTSLAAVILLAITQLTQIKLLIVVVL